MRSFRFVLAAVAIIGLAAFAVPKVTSGTPATTITGTQVRYVGPFYTTQMSFDSTNGGQVGGEVREYLAGSTLLIGDVVYLSADNTVDKSTTASNHEKDVGIVIGGRSTQLLVSTAAADVGTTAATVGRPVIVLRHGRTYCPNDAGGTLNAGDRLKPSTTTAGKLMGATVNHTATIAYTNADTIRSGGTTVTSTAANGAIIGHSAATITVAGDGVTKVIGTVVKGGALSTTVLCEVDAK